MDSLQSSMGLTSLVCTVLNFQLAMALAVESVADGNTDMATVNAVIDTFVMNLVTYLGLMGAWTAADSILFDIPQHEEGGDIVARWGQSTLSTAVRGGNRRHDEDGDDAKTNVGVVPNSGGGGGGDNGDRTLFHRRRHRNDDRRTRRRRR